MNWLFKEEPKNYSYDDLVRDGKTSWTGVRNPVAQRNLRSVKKGDKNFFYHTGKEKAVVGICRAAADAYPDPADKTGTLYAVDGEPVKISPSTTSRISALSIRSARLGITMGSPHAALAAARASFSLMVWVACSSIMLVHAVMPITGTRGISSSGKSILRVVLKR